MKDFLHCYKNITNYMVQLHKIFVLVYIFVTIREIYTLFTKNF